MGRRQSFEAGHTRKFLVVIDDTTECERAVYYAARRAERTRGGLVMLYVIEPAEFQHWLGVEAIMRQEALDEADSVLGGFSEKVAAYSSVAPEHVVREGKHTEEIARLIDEDPDIAILVLAAGTGTEGPGPLVSALASRSIAGFSIPVTIVPGDLSDADIDALA
ncbi:MAG: universal stress protein [Pseudomonadota bacterium]